MKPTGWYLGLRYMQGRGLVAREAGPVEAEHRGAQFLFADRILLSASFDKQSNGIPLPSREGLGEGAFNNTDVWDCVVPPLPTSPARGEEFVAFQRQRKISNWQLVLQDWWDALAVGGFLILWLPDCRHQDLQAGEARLTLEQIEHALDDKQGWQLFESDLIEGHIYCVWQKRGDDKQLRTPWRKQTQHLLIARSGAHGDALMASSILPRLKEQGWTISFITKRPGADVLRHDPHVDELILQADGQVTDEELPYYWQAWQQRFDRFINLTHSVEGELLKQPGRPDYFWPEDQRRNQCKRSYLKYVHQLAGVAGPYRVCFYPDESEKFWAARKALDYGRFAVWCLRGSAVHKWWPYGPQAICQLLARTHLNFVLTGDAEALPLAEEIKKAARHYYGDDKRIHSLVGTHSIREIMALAHYASVVVGPETGVMNAVSLQAVPKVLLLSHSAPENLSDDWIATTALKPTANCYPCHRLHYGHEWCPQDEATSAAACAASISTEQLVSAVINTSHHKAMQPWWVGKQRIYAA